MRLPWARGQIDQLPTLFLGDLQQQQRHRMAGGNPDQYRLIVPPPSRHVIVMATPGAHKIERSAWPTNQQGDFGDVRGGFCLRCQWGMDIFLRECEVFATRAVRFGKTECSCETTSGSTPASPACALRWSPRNERTAVDRPTCLPQASARRDGSWYFIRPTGALTIARRRFIRREEDTSKQLRINERIRISPVRLIDENSEQVGVVETDKALQMARDAGLDLVEVAPNVRPPVCRIIDYGKWKYQQKKKEAKAKSHSKQSELKEIRVRPSTDDHDLELKMNRTREFLDEGHKVQFTMMFRGRQMAHKDIGFDNFRKIADDLEDVAKVEVAPRSMGRRMTMIVAPLSKQDRKAREAKSAKAGEPKPKDAKAPQPDKPVAAPPPNVAPPTHQSPNV